MYSGFAVSSKGSGRVFGVHQKIDRVARQNLQHLLGERRQQFPAIKEILHFEGLNGPDGIKRKSPAQDEPWHYINPSDESDTGLLTIITDHYQQLIIALKHKNTTRAAFEAAWLSHAVVDGLTPAHHYPYEAKLAELRGGEGLETRTTIRKKLSMGGETRREKLSNNWKAWGPNGLFIAHSSFEAGVAAIIALMSFKNTVLDPKALDNLQQLGIEKWFQGLVKEVSALNLFDKFVSRGWSTRLARQVRRELIPLLVKTIIVVWYSAALEAGLAEA